MLIFDECETHFLYVMESGPGQYLRSKIGISCNPDCRRRDLNQQSPFPVRLVQFWEISKSRADELEDAAHELLWDKRVHGEWFRVPSHIACNAVWQALRDAGLYKFRSELSDLEPEPGVVHVYPVFFKADAAAGKKESVGTATSPITNFDPLPPSPSPHVLVGWWGLPLMHVLQ